MVAAWSATELKLLSMLCGAAKLSETLGHGKGSFWGTNGWPNGQEDMFGTSLNCHASPFHGNGDGMLPFVG